MEGGGAEGVISDRAALSPGATQDPWGPGRVSPVPGAGARLG